MKFTVAGGNWYSDWPAVERAVPVAEESGFWGFLLPDHYMSHREHGGYSTLDSWIILSYLASRTSSIRLGTLVTPIPFRPPGLLAKMVGSLDVLSSGRIVLGVGAGWSREEFEGYSEWSNAKTLVDKTEEGLQLILRLWEKKSVNFDGRFYKAKGAVLEPKPVQKPNPPLLFGGEGPRMLKMAGKYGDICYIPDWAEPGFVDARELVVKEAKRNSRTEKLSFAAGSPSPLDPKHNSGRYVALVEEAVKNGCKYFIVAFPQPEKAYLNAMKRFANDIIPSFDDRKGTGRLD